MPIYFVFVPKISYLQVYSREPFYICFVHRAPPLANSLPIINEELADAQNKVLRVARLAKTVKLKMFMSVFVNDLRRPSHFNFK